MRALALYLRSRRAAPTLTAVAGLVAALWTVGRAVDGAGVLGLLAVVAGLAMVGPGLAGPDTDLDRTAAVAWPPRRAAHLTVAVTAVALLVAAAGLGGDGRLIRDAAGLGGLLGLGAATLGAQRAWLVPMTWTLLGSVVLGPVWREPTAGAVRTRLDGAAVRHPGGRRDGDGPRHGRPAPLRPARPGAHQPGVTPSRTRPRSRRGSPRRSACGVGRFDAGCLS